MQTLQTTDFKFPYHFTRYGGKVRDVYVIEEEVMVFVATDRISAFDVILPRPIPTKGQILNELAAWWLKRVAHVGPTHILSVPDPNVTIGRKCDPYPVEFIIRGRLCGHAWREYKSGKRVVSGVELPDNLKENDPLPEPILTPTTKSKIGHDMDITEQEITKSGLIPADEFYQIKHRALTLFAEGQRRAAEVGLILADTKYEFGHRDFEIVLIDEIHTPDSSRYFYADGFEERQAKGERHPQISKEYVREWLMSIGFQGQEGVDAPYMPDDVLAEVMGRYADVYNRLTGSTFTPRKPEANLHETVHQNILNSLKDLGF